MQQIFPPTFLHSTKNEMWINGRVIVIKISGVCFSGGLWQICVQCACVYAVCWSNKFWPISLKMLMSPDNQRSSNREPFHLIVSAIDDGGRWGVWRPLVSHGDYLICSNKKRTKTNVRLVCTNTVHVGPSKNKLPNCALLGLSMWIIFDIKASMVWLANDVFVYHILQ